MSTELTDESPMPFGDYKGTPLGNVPDQYLLNLYNSGKCFGPIKIYIGKNLDAIELNIKQQQIKNRQKWNTSKG